MMMDQFLMEHMENIALFVLKKITGYYLEKMMLNYKLKDKDIDFIQIKKEQFSKKI